MTLPSHINYPVLVPRWEPNTRERLTRAALDLFTEQGYDATIVSQIAERAGVTQMTFFRHSRTSGRYCSRARRSTAGPWPTRSP